MIEMGGHDALWMYVGDLVLHSPLTPPGLVESLAVYFLREGAGGLGVLSSLQPPLLETPCLWFPQHPWGLPSPLSARRAVFSDVTHCHHALCH